MGRLVDFGKSLVADGYRLVGWSAPILSMLFTLAKWQEWSVMEIDLAEISYAWAFAPFTLWFFIAYVRRYNAYRSLEEAKPAIQHTYTNCVVHQHADGTTTSEPKASTVDTSQPTFVQFNPGSLEIIEENNIMDLIDNGLGDFTINFDEEIVADYFVQVLSDKNLEHEIRDKSRNSFNIYFPVEPTELIRLVVQEA